MDIRYYKLPINLDAVVNNDDAEIQTCSELESIDQYIELILTTCPGEHQFNKSFGCRIWDLDFEKVVSRKKWEEDFTAHIKEAIEYFEQRIKDVSVFIHIAEITREDRMANITAIKKRVTVQIKGALVSTGQPCSFKYKLYLGPLATE